MFLDSPDLKEILEFLATVDFLETVETLVLWVFLVTLVSPLPQSW